MKSCCVYGLADNLVEYVGTSPDSTHIVVAAGIEEESDSRYSGVGVFVK